MAKASSSSGSAGGRMNAFLQGEIAAKIRKTHGASILQKACDMPVQDIPLISSGIFMLDYALGGGWPVGRINTLYGPKSGGKTTTLLRTIANAQKLCRLCYRYLDKYVEKEIVSPEALCKCKGDVQEREFSVLYMDVESAWDPKWARMHGIDDERLAVSAPEYAEQSLDLAEAAILSGQIDIVALDSIAFLTPQKEIEESTAKDLMGAQPRVVGKGIRKFVSALNTIGNSNHGRKPTVFFTNQIRMKLGMLFGNPETSPGGMAPGFSASTEVRVEAGKVEVDETLKRPVSIEMKFKVDKNKMAAPKVTGTYNMMLFEAHGKKIGELYDEPEIIAEAERMGLVEKKGNGWGCLGESFPKRDALEERMLKDRAFNNAMRKALMQVLQAVAGQTITE
jgi:recombination protein RecA